MRTTLDLEDDVLAAAKELARRQGTSVQPQAAEAPAIGGFRPFPALGARVVTNEAIDQLRDQTGL